ncbi:MAG: prepilin-type N-terminal cleavage/methylation domain-containing protein [Candidatus Saccharimonadales bacterium]
MKKCILQLFIFSDFNHKNTMSKQGFTIVELLVVIVVIGILAAITIISYAGISQKAIVASMHSDLASAKRQLEVFQTINGVYPTTIDCDIPDSETNQCLKTSSNNTYTTYQASRAYNYPTFTLYISNSSNDTIYRMTNGSGSSPVQTYKQISAGYYHGCAIAADDQAYCTGLNNNGQLGSGNLVNSAVPVPVINTGVLNGLTIKSITAGYLHNCAIASNDQGYCWGDGVQGQLGRNSTADSSSPVALVDAYGVLGGLTIKDIQANYYNTCAIASNDNLYCWGDNIQGQIGDNSTTDRRSPVALVDANGVLGGLTIKSVAIGYFHACVIASNDQIYCWGDNAQGQLGNNTTTDSLAPISIVDANGILGGLSFKYIAAGSYSTCAVATNDQVFCWGDNPQGQLGNNTIVDSLAPVAVTDTGNVLNGLTIKSLTAGWYHTCVIGSNDLAYCWGDGAQGQLGRNSVADSRVPVAVPATGLLAGLTLKSISAGNNYHTCTIASDDNAYCWGYNLWGQLGNNSVTRSLAPAEVVSP